jgi:hypothetical protein
MLFLFAYTYVCKQTFSIPGSFFLNLIAGALYGVEFGFPFVCVLTGKIAKQLPGTTDHVA